MISIEEMKRPPVNREEFLFAYQILKRNCAERWQCSGCWMYPACQKVGKKPEEWPELEEEE